MQRHTLIKAFYLSRLLCALWHVLHVAATYTVDIELLLY